MTMTSGFKTLALAGTLIAAPFLATASYAATIVGLVDGKADIKGAASIVGIDVRPADGMLYAVAADGGIYTVDAKTGAATMKSKLSETLKAGVTVTVDFNPVADRVEVHRHGDAGLERFGELALHGGDTGLGVDRVDAAVGGHRIQHTVGR